MSSKLPDELSIQVDGLGKEYRRGGVFLQQKSLRDELMHMLSPVTWLTRRRTEIFPALTDISFCVARGERLGIIGPNGAGKSTLLKILCRVSLPSRGSVAMRGIISAILEVGTGFHPELSGRENVYLNGALLGLTREEINERFGAIVEFSGIGRFIDEPTKHYSSGMYVRLAFSIAAHLDPDILIVDEVLAVGDIQFRAKCLERMRSFTHDAKRTIVLVSHDVQAVAEVCTRCLVIADGRLVFDGPTPQAIACYQALTPALPPRDAAGLS